MGMGLLIAAVVITFTWPSNGRGSQPSTTSCGITGVSCDESNPVHEESGRKPGGQPALPPQQPRQPQPFQACETVKVPLGHGYSNAYTYEQRCHTEWR
ncbi:hypothetical protein GCM10010357_66870 [Streptomyces luteireticuli]|uniref:Secreted protein n=1 Tax=Streptomyces luteireticuli TaxID=173858 RepID=A0ABN0Z6Y9_9ACTN